MVLALDSQHKESNSGGQRPLGDFLSFESVF